MTTFMLNFVKIIPLLTVLVVNLLVVFLIVLIVSYLIARFVHPKTGIFLGSLFPAILIIAIINRFFHCLSWPSFINLDNQNLFVDFCSGKPGEIYVYFGIIAFIFAVTCQWLLWRIYKKVTIRHQTEPS